MGLPSSTHDLPKRESLQTIHNDVDIPASSMAAASLRHAAGLSLPSWQRKSGTELLVSRELDDKQLSNVIAASSRRP